MLLTFLVMLFICLKLPGQLNAAKAGSGAADVFRVALFCPDLLLHRARIELQKALGGGDRQAGIGLRSGTLRVHHLDWPCDIMDILPWR